MFYSASTDTIYLSPTSLELDLHHTAPFLLTIDPRNGLSLEYLKYKPYKIEYNFGDGSPVYTQTLSPTPSANLYYTRPTDNTLPWPKEPGDPRNFPISHQYYLSGSVVTNVQTTITIFWFAPTTAAEDRIQYSLNISLSAGNLQPRGYNQNSVFGDIHLHSVRMFGENDVVLYNFESSDPNYLLPTIVDWKTYDQPVRLPSIIESLPTKALGGYKWKAPFER